MAKKGGSKEGFTRDPSISMPSEQKTSESSKQKIAKIHDVFPTATKDQIAKILQYYEDDENKAVDALTRDGGQEALSNWAESGSLKSRNNKNKKKKKKSKKESGSGIATMASFDADDSSSLHSSGNVEADGEKECSRAENGNGILHDVDESKNSSLHERLKNAEGDLLHTEQTKGLVSPRGDSKSNQEMYLHATSEQSSSRRDENISCASPVSDSSERQDDQNSKKDKYRSNKDEVHPKHTPRQRAGSFRRSKTSSLSEDSSQHNPQAAAVPTKRGYEKCKKDLNRQTISLQRIQSQLDKGLEESGKKLKNAFSEVRKMLDKRQELIEQELEKTKEEALALLKSRQDLAVELKRRVDRTSSLTEAEWSELRSDIKQFVTERKYDEELGKNIWFLWSMDSITENVNTFGEVNPVKNVYSQRSHSALGNSGTALNPEPSPSSSVVNEEMNSTADKNDVGNISDTVEDEAPAVEKDTPPYKTQARVFSNKRFSYGRFPNNNRGNRGYNRGGRGFAYSRPNYNRSYNYRNNYNYDFSGDYRNHPHQERDGRISEGHVYSNDRNMNSNPRDNRNERNQGRGPNSNYRSGNGGRYRGNMNQQRQNVDNIPKTEPHTNEATAVENEKSTIVNGYANN